jgi:hypothetical protein
MNFDSYYSPAYRNEHSPLLFMDAKPDSIQLGGGQDAQQYSQSPLEDMWNLQTISPSDLTAPSPNSIQIYKDEDVPFNHPANSVPPIDIALATSRLNPAGPSSSDSTTPVTPLLLSPSQVGYASSPSLLNVSPSTPAHALGPMTEVYHTFPTSAPVSPYPSHSPSQLSPWHISNAQSSPEPERLHSFNEHQRGPMVPQKRYKPHTSSAVPYRLSG